MQKKMWVTDLDGTLLDNQEQLPTPLHDAIDKIDSSTIKVIATGRNLEKVRRVINNQQLFDFIIFSSGAGIFNTNSQELVRINNLSINISRMIFKFLDQEQHNFIYTKKVPNNQKLFFKKNYSCSHFNKYITSHQRELDPRISSLNEELAQFMVFIPNKKEKIQSLMDQIHSISKDLQVIRTTSPIDSSFCWIEVFHKNVSKGKAVLFLSEFLSIDLENIIGVGNDYNDVDFLSIIGNPYVMANSPQDLKEKFEVVSNNENHGVLEVLKKHGIV
ncbi:HAD family hydrolase [Prolixibacteraceae bacterium]|nr:HAD family hydrolase [Prolixibacteraceae bacterium]